MKSFWIGKLNNNSLPVYLLSIHIGENFKFHSNLEISRDKAKMFYLSRNSEKLGFYHMCVSIYIINYCFSNILKKLIKNMRTDKKAFYIPKMSKKLINSTVQILRENFRVKSWNDLIAEYTLDEKQDLNVQMI